MATVPPSVCQSRTHPGPIPAFEADLGAGRPVRPTPVAGCCSGCRQRRDGGDPPCLAPRSIEPYPPASTAPAAACAPEPQRCGPPRSRSLGPFSGLRRPG
jgi:hypothetical protein